MNIKGKAERTKQFIIEQSAPIFNSKGIAGTTIDDILAATKMAKGGKTMPETVAPDMPMQNEIASCKWLTENELNVYTEEFKRTGFHGGLNCYRCTTSGLKRSDLELFAGHTIDVPSCFISGVADWARFRPAGALEQMQHKACTKMQSFHIIEGAGH